MKTLPLILIFVICTTFVYSQVKVKGYYKSNGTYVAPHVRSSPNSTKTDNYSYPGNSTPSYSSPTNTTPSSGNSGNYISPKSSDVWVDGYWRNGTYVEGHWRSAPNDDPTDNFSHPGNINPYTGKVASGGNDNSSIGTVNTTKLNVRSGPSTDYPVLGTLEIGDDVIIKENVNSDWKKIQYSYYDDQMNYIVKTGYVASSYLNESIEDKKSDDSELKTNKVDFSDTKVIAATYQYVNTEKLNLRDTPSTNGKIVEILKKGTRVYVLEVIDSNWVKVQIRYYDFSGNITTVLNGYVSSIYLL